MKPLALMLILALQSTGLWSHLPAERRANLSARATGITAPATVSVAPTQPTIVPLPISNGGTQPPSGAAAAIAIDRTTATILYAKNISVERPVASVTKMITALVVISRHDPSETVTIPTLPDYPKEAETIGLVPGDTFRLSDLLEALLVPSANDAADALAIWDASSVTKFAARMNAKMADWGIEGTRFSGASGLEDSGNYATAAALAKIAGLELTTPLLSTIVTHTSGSITSGQGRSYDFKTTNQLLASGQFYGIKTGYTLAAGECFVGLTRINGRDVITVVLGADDRFGATTTITNWIAKTWQWY